LRLVRLSTLIPNGKPSRRQKPINVRTLVRHWS
jgi:hypothetical protein